MREGRWFIWLLFVLAAVVAADSLHLVGDDEDGRPPVGVLGEVITRDTVAPAPTAAPAPPPEVTTTTSTTVATTTTTTTVPRTTAAPTTAARPPATTTTTTTTTTTVVLDTTVSTWPPYNSSDTVAP